MYSDKLLGNSKLTCKWQTCTVYNRNWVLKFCGGHIYIHAVHVAISHCIFVRQHLRALNFRRPWNTPPKKISYADDGVFVIKKKKKDLWLFLESQSFWRCTLKWKRFLVCTQNPGRWSGQGAGWWKWVGGV